MKIIFKNTGDNYVKQGDYFLSTLTLPDKSERQIGMWGMKRRQYLKSNHRVLYYYLLTSGISRYAYEYSYTEFKPYTPADIVGDFFGTFE